MIAFHSSFSNHQFEGRMGADDKINILIVDDLPEKLLVLGSILEELNENVVTASSGPEALRRVLDDDFAVILLDINMPGMDGFETADLIRKRRKSAHTPIIFITAFADELHTAQGYSLGAVDYILSPVVPEILRTKVKVFVDLYRMTQQVRQQADERVALASEQAARAAAEEATRRSAFLAEASKVLSSSLDTEATLRGLLRLVVPRLSDMAGVTLLAESSPEWCSELAWFSEAQQQLHFGSLAGSERPPDEVRSALERVLAGGEAEVLEGLAVPYPPPGCAEGVETEGLLHSAILLPLQARGRTLGALILEQGKSGRSFSPADRALADDLAGRAAIALDNARLYRNVQEADRHKNEFLSMLAHELRNPLAPIRNAVQILRMRNFSEPDIQLVQDMIDRQVQQLSRLVDDLLDLSRITRGKIRLQTEVVEVASVVARAVETSRPLIDARKHKLTVLLPTEPLRVRGDPVRLAQVLANLLNNAAKYTEEGGRIAVTAERDRDEVVLRVKDTGMGIPPDMLSSIFELFTQVDRSLDRSQGGLGIGLTLAHKLVEMHGGRVEAFSAGPNQGSELVVHLPLVAEEVTTPDNGAGKPPGKQRRCRVLIVDDNMDGARSLSMLLDLFGHDVRTCYDGPSALVEAEEFFPEIVLLDIGLPGMDGFEVARRLREQPTCAQTLLVALTGYGQAEDIRRSREAGFDHHLVKPADPEALRGLLSSVALKLRQDCPV
jgi:signal transduction histidine kinase/DNA-binding response OmpR family regulator